MLDWCADAGAAAIPFGGGTSVVGGVEPRVGDAYAGAVTIDLRALDRVVEVDRDSRAALIEAGATGPRLEEQLREHGYTLRHFPQSFEYATLGGWIATRAGGHFATLMTHIDDLVESVRAITPAGVWESRRLPGSGAGPSPDRMLIGSRGDPRRDHARVDARAGPAAVQGVGGRDVRVVRRRARAAVRALSQSGLYPSNCRLLDPGEAALTGASTEGALLVLGFESADHPLDAWMDRALELCADHGGSAEREIGARLGRGTDAWRGAFLQAPYLRDTLVAAGVISETFETAITWDRFDSFVADVRERAEAAVARDLRRRPGHLPADARLPRRRGAVLHLPGARAPRQRGRAVGRDQGRGVRGDHRRAAGRSPTTTPSAATTGPGTTASGRTRSPTRCARPSARSTPPGSSTRAC